MRYLLCMANLGEYLARTLVGAGVDYGSAEAFIRDWEAAITKLDAARVGERSQGHYPFAALINSYGQFMKQAEHDNPL